SASHIKVVQASPGSAFLPNPIAFHPSGRIIDVRLQIEPAFGIVYERHLLDSLGHASEVQKIPPAPRDRVPVFGYESGTMARTRSGFFIPLYGPRHLVAHAPGGDWAEAISDEYAIRWYD